VPLALLASLAACPSSGVITSAGTAGVSGSGGSSSSASSTSIASNTTGAPSSSATTTTSSATTSSSYASTGGATSSGGHSSTSLGTSTGTTSSGGVTTGSSSTGSSGSAGTSSGSASSSGGSALGPLVQTFVGVNGFTWDSCPGAAGSTNCSPSPLNVAGSIREYTDWSWTEGTIPYPNNEDDWYDWSHDAFYAVLFDAGVQTMPCVEQGVFFVNDGGIPPANGDPNLPASYAAHGDQMFQYAARYGSTSVPLSLLKDDAGYSWAFPEPALTGLGEIHYYENGNEEDATWVLPDGGNLAPAAEMAAQCSADYDGDQGRMGPTIGVKNADPNAQLVLAGLSQGYVPGSGISYLNGMLAWSNANRGGSVPFDVINLHHYSTANSPTASGVSPEADNLVSQMQAFTSWRDANTPGKEVWVTEFGYDSNSASPLGCPTLGANSNFVVQGQWIVRSMLAQMQAGISRAFIYWIADQPCGVYCADMFNSCGLIDVDGGYKASYYFVNTFRATLATMRYVAPVASGNASVDIATFQDTLGADGAYVLWAPTSNATVVNGYTLKLAADATRATQVLLEDQQLNGSSSALTVTTGTVSVDVTETPTLVLVDHLN
jgi:hypothetical protein